MKIDILYEDSFIIIVNKPNNLLIHNSYYARNIKDATLLELLTHQFNTDFYPIHRLDRKTSGIIVLAKQKEQVAIFQELFNSKSIQKVYLGIVRGFINESRTINTNVKHPETKIYKEAETYCEPLLTKSLEIPVHPYKSSRYSFVKLIPKTGRIHQLRIHMNKISHPIIGDYKYGDRFHNRMFEKEFNCNKLFLHAYSISFMHPILAKQIYIKASLPNDWIKIMETFNWKF